MQRLLSFHELKKFRKFYSSTTVQVCLQHHSQHLCNEQLGQNYGPTMSRSNNQYRNKKVGIMLTMMRTSSSVGFSPIALITSSSSSADIAPLPSCVQCHSFVWQWWMIIIVLIRQMRPCQTHQKPPWTRHSSTDLVPGPSSCYRCLICCCATTYGGFFKFQELAAFHY